MSYSPVSPCRLVTSVLPMDYLTPDGAMCAVPELAAAGGYAGGTRAPSAMARASSALRSGHRWSCPRVRTARHHPGGDGLALLELFEQPDKGANEASACSVRIRGSYA